MNKKVSKINRMVWFKHFVSELRKLKKLLYLTNEHVYQMNYIKGYLMSAYLSGFISHEYYERCYRLFFIVAGLDVDFLEG